MQALFDRATTGVRTPLDPNRCPRGTAFPAPACFGSAKPESEATGRCEERSRESAVRDSLRSYSRTGDQASSVRPRHTPDPRAKDTLENPLLSRGGL